MITIYRGDDTGGAFGRVCTIRVVVDDGLSLENCVGEFSYAGITKRLTNLVSGVPKEIHFSHNETEKMPYGTGCGVFRIIDAAGKIRTFDDKVRVTVTRELKVAYPGASEYEVHAGPEIPPASESTLGVVKVGQGLAIDEDGTLSVTSTPLESVGWENVTDTPTTVDGYGITDAIKVGDNRLVSEEEKSVWNGKQDALESGANIKTVNGESLLGDGNIDITGAKVYVLRGNAERDGFEEDAQTVFDACASGDPVCAFFGDDRYYITAMHKETEAEDDRPHVVFVGKDGNARLDVWFSGDVVGGSYEAYWCEVDVGTTGREEAFRDSNLDSRFGWPDNIGKIYQYTGETNADFTQGYFYRLGEGFVWTQVDVQPKSDVQVDSELDETSVNPIQNKAVANAVAERAYGKYKVECYDSGFYTLMISNQGAETQYLVTKSYTEWYAVKSVQSGTQYTVVIDDGMDTEIRFDTTGLYWISAALFATHLTEYGRRDILSSQAFKDAVGGLLTGYSKECVGTKSTKLKSGDCSTVTYADNMTIEFAEASAGTLRQFEILITGCVAGGSINYPDVVYRGDVSSLILEAGDNHLTFAEYAPGAFFVTRSVANIIAGKAVEVGE